MGGLRRWGCDLALRSSFHSEASHHRRRGPILQAGSGQRWHTVGVIEGLEAADVVVIGAGVIGLTIAVRLVEFGRAVVVLTDRDPQRTTSAAAGAMLGISGTPPDDPATRWTQAATPVFDLLADDPTRACTGCTAGSSRTSLTRLRPGQRSCPISARCPSRSTAGFVAAWL